ncbi:uncharacterized protein LOC124776372 [Schistocerca piceifrons]|uniref:uncharacterized protein LOC124776372 n=1 Tax=Schistocerca piceifrons TaxID=274613 RepID=UPI001F5EF3D0|nr:uncharacterized protein LOC124776372 [Schistocerca piceifrons]
MASVKDTATFFAKGTSNQFAHVLKLYPEALKAKADSKNKKPEEMIKLDNWYQNELPKKLKARGKDTYLIHEELVQTMKWKQTRGKFYPQLSYLVKVNTPRAVMLETRKAFRKLPNLESAITTLSNLKGVGTTMASALLAAVAPDQAPFMADECLMAIPEIEGIDYTTKEYLNFVQHIQNAVERLNKESNNGTWNPHQVELALWTHYVVSEMKPELLDGMPGPHENGTTNHEEKNGDTLKTQDPENSSDESTQDSTNGKNLTGPADALDDTTTSFTEDSLDKPSTPTVGPLCDETTNDSVATTDSGTNDSAAIATAIVACNNKRGSISKADTEEGDDTTSSLEEPPAKKNENWRRKVTQV